MSKLDYTNLEKRIANLEKAVFGEAGNQVNIPAEAYNWALNERAFVSRYAPGMTGTQKFVLLVAYLTKGDVDKQIPLKDVEKLWRKMTAKSLLGMKFNRKYTSDAQVEGWIAVPSRGRYQLAYGWTEIGSNSKDTKAD